MNELCHHGIKGQKWGVRRYQYEDGSLTPGGKKRYAKDQYRQATKSYRRREINKEQYSQAKKDYKTEKQQYKKTFEKEFNDIVESERAKPLKIMYKDYVYKNAAQKVVDEGMDREKALSKAKAQAWIKVGEAYAAGAILNFSAAHLDEIAYGLKNIINQRTIQKANAGLARIGTMKLEKVAGDIYKYRMK